jgi:hypothetical protein
VLRSSFLILFPKKRNKESLKKWPIVGVEHEIQDEPGVSCSSRMSGRAQNKTKSTMSNDIVKRTQEPTERVQIQISMTEQTNE